VRRHQSAHTALESGETRRAARLFPSGRGPSEPIIFIAGQTALDESGALVGKDDFVAQADKVFHNLAFALEAVGCTAANLVKLTVFLRDMDNLGAYREARNRFFATVSPQAAPAVTLVEVSKLYGPDFLIEVEAVAAAWAPD
jgi:enamine deaminase RidA (YjgF/YER057c/UK114 family)